MFNKTVAEITAALQKLRESMAQAMGKKRMEEVKMKETQMDIEALKNTIKEKEAGIRLKEVEIQKFRQMIMETKSLMPRRENELKKLQTDYAQVKRESEMHQQEMSRLQHELEEAQHGRPQADSQPEHTHF